MSPGTGMSPGRAAVGCPAWLRRARGGVPGMGEPPRVGRAVFGEGGGCWTGSRDRPPGPSAAASDATMHRATDGGFQRETQLEGGSWHPALHPRVTPPASLEAARSPHPTAPPSQSRAPPGGRGASSVPAPPFLPGLCGLFVPEAGPRPCLGRWPWGHQPGKATSSSTFPPINEDAVNWGHQVRQPPMWGQPRPCATPGRRHRHPPARRSPVYLGADHKQGTRCPGRVSHPGSSPRCIPTERGRVTGG